MWKRVPTAEENLDCRTPFSFFFDLIEKYWKALPNTSNKLSLHRLCTLARKQGANFVCVECALGRPDVQEEIDAVDDKAGGGGEAQAIAISFFSGEQSPSKIEKVASDDALGTAVVINYKKKGELEYTFSYVYEAIMSPPHKRDPAGKRRGLLNNYICRDSKFRRTIRGREFALTGFYYCQQNHFTHVCAHASLRMAMNTIDGAAAPLTAAAINKYLGVKDPEKGLQLGQTADMIEAHTGSPPIIKDCTTLPSKKDYISILASYIESGCIVLLVFTTGNPAEDHVVTVFGHTRNSDEWHPQALPGYSGAPNAGFYPSSAWVDHFVIHDDNLGPYYTLSSRALEVDPNITASQIICIHPRKVDVSPHFAESLGAVVLEQNAPGWAKVHKGGRWFDFVTQPRTFVMRAILISRDRYFVHLSAAKAHDGTSLTQPEVDLFSSLPDWFWMVEYSVPELFTGNRSKLGEILFSIDSTANLVDAVLAIRAPDMIIVRNNTNAFSLHQSGMSAHSPIYVARPHDNEW